MTNTILKEGLDILKKLSPKNETYFMTLLRLDEVSENGVKSETINCQREPPKNKPA